jgi:hypothetical protein
MEVIRSINNKLLGKKNMSVQKKYKSLLHLGGFLLFPLLIGFLVVAQSDKPREASAAESPLPFHSYSSSNQSYSAPTVSTLTTNTPIATIGIGNQSQWKGLTAISPSTRVATAKNVVTFTEGDVRQYFKTAVGWGLIKSNSAYSVDKVEFLAYSDIKLRLGSSMPALDNIDNGKIFCLVTVRGNFSTSHGPPSATSSSTDQNITFPSAFQLFDGQTGNLLLMGVTKK